jgi:CDP-diacylglycerol--serine O-phosphatidyltransferase
MASAYRLAKFNIDERQHTGFLGLATPAHAVFAASLPLIVFTNAYGLGTLLLDPWVLYAIILIFSWLMVSELPMFSLKSKSLGWKGNELLIIFSLVAIFLVFFFKYSGIAVAILLYILICAIRFLFFRKPTALNSTEQHP